MKKKEKIELDKEILAEKGKKKKSITLGKLLLIIAIIIVCIISFINIYIYKIMEKAKRNIYSPVLRDEVDIEKNVVCNKLNIDMYTLNQIEKEFLEDRNIYENEIEENEIEENKNPNRNLEDETDGWTLKEVNVEGFSAESGYKRILKEIESYIVLSDENYTDIIYNEIMKKKVDPICSKWYANVLSGFIKYHLGGDISFFKIKTYGSYSVSGLIVIDKNYNIDFWTGDRYGLELHLRHNKYKELDVDFNLNEYGDFTGTAKPIIYIYPEQETIVNVKLGKSENLTCTYPKYDENEGWNVIAKPNGDLQDLKTGKNLYALYWEGIGTKVYDYTNPEEGFVIEGENIAEFLEEKLEVLGLNEREAEEFIVYWLPQMEKNKYNYIRFETKEEIEAEMPLGIEPKPDTVIRVLMDWKALDEKIEVKEQKLEKTEREGYTVVEWGGSELKENIVR